MTTKSKKMDADAMLAALNAPATQPPVAPMKAEKAEKAPKSTEKGVIFRMSVGDWKRLKAVALDRDTTMQGLLEDGVNALLKSRGMPPIGQSRNK